MVMLAAAVHVDGNASAAAAVVAGVAGVDVDFDVGADADDDVAAGVVVAVFRSRIGLHSFGMLSTSYLVHGSFLLDPDTYIFGDLWYFYC